MGLLRAQSALLFDAYHLVRRMDTNRHLGVQRRRVTRNERRALAYRVNPHWNRRTNHLPCSQKREKVSCAAASVLNLTYAAKTLTITWDCGVSSGKSASLSF